MMRTLFAIIVTLSVLCGSLGIEYSDESVSKVTEGNVEQDGESNQYDQELERVLRRKSNTGTTKKYMKRGDEPEYYKEKASKKSKKESKKEYHYEDVEEKAHGVYIQTLTCPGQCFTLATSPGLEDSPYVGHEACDNCDPNQKWRIHPYKGNLVQLEHVATGECACVREAPFQGIEVCEDVLKFGPCHKYGEPSELSLFYSQGGQFFPEICVERGFSSQFSTVPEPGIELDFCGVDGDGQPFPVFLNPTIGNEDGEFVFPDSFFMVTECLLNPNQCNYDWW